MNTEKLIQFFTTKLEKLAEFRNAGKYGDPEFTTWWNTIKSTCERMGESYKKKADSVHFTPRVVTMGGDNSNAYSQAFQRGLNDAEAFIKSLLEELNTWGYGDDTKNNVTEKSPADNKVILNLTISQHQVQQITQTINLAQYDSEVQTKVQELLNELKKETKDKSKITNAVKWLADKGVDALIAILLASTHLT